MSGNRAATAFLAEAADQAALRYATAELAHLNVDLATEIP